MRLKLRSRRLLRGEGACERGFRADDAGRRVGGEYRRGAVWVFGGVVGELFA